MKTLRFSTIWDSHSTRSRKGDKATADMSYTKRFLTIWDTPRPQRVEPEAAELDTETKSRQAA